MSAQCEITAKQAVGAPMSVFERYLSVWVFLCIVTGMLLVVKVVNASKEWYENG
jgi:ACR3 family arsenite transporter